MTVLLNVVVWVVATERVVFVDEPSYTTKLSPPTEVILPRSPPARYACSTQTTQRTTPADPAPVPDMAASHHRAHRTDRLVLGVDPIACAGHGLCAKLLPEMISLDE